MVLGDLELDVFPPGVEGDEDVDRGAQGIQNDRDPVPVVERLPRFFERGAEPDLEPELAGERLEFLQVLAGGSGEIIAVDDDRVGGELAERDHGLDAFEDLLGARTLLLEVHDDPVLDDLVVDVHGVLQFPVLGDLLEDVLVPGDDVVDAARIRDVDDGLALEQLVRGDVDQAGRLAHAFGRGEDADVPAAQPAVDGFLQNPQRAPLDQFGFDHRRTLLPYFVPSRFRS